jgi:hypothetical protein
MSIRKSSEIQGGYEMVPNALLNDGRLNATELALAIKLLAQKPSYTIEPEALRVSKLVNDDDRHKFDKTWRTLVACEYLVETGVEVDPWAFVSPAERQVKRSVSNGHYQNGTSHDGGGSNPAPVPEPDAGQIVSELLQDLSQKYQLTPVLRDAARDIVTRRIAQAYKGTALQQIASQDLWDRAVEHERDSSRHMSLAMQAMAQGDQIVDFAAVDLPEADKGHVIYPHARGRYGSLCILFERHEWKSFGRAVFCVYCNAHHATCGCPAPLCKVDHEEDTE